MRKERFDLERTHTQHNMQDKATYRLAIVVELSTPLSPKVFIFRLCVPSSA